MTPEHEDKNEHLRRRRAQRQEQRQAKERRLAILRLAVVLTVLALVAGLIAWTAGNSPGAIPGESTNLTSPTAQTGLSEEEETSAEEEAYTVIRVAVAGDLNVTDEILAAAASPSGHDFSGTFLEVAPVLSAADLAILNFEGTLAGAPYGTDTGSAPGQLAQTLADIGIDAVQTANSAAIRAGVLGLRSTIASLQNVGITPVGTFTDSDAFRRSGGFTMMEVDGIQVALVAFTKGMDNLGLPEGSENCVNLLYEDYTSDYKEIASDAITDVLRDVAAAGPDVTIALVHWGSEYNENISDSQKAICKLMKNHGVDAIIGTHSHLLKQIDYDEKDKTLVAWSLGDFYGNATEAGSNYSVILELEITRDNQMERTSITGYNTVPIYTMKPNQSTSGDHRVLDLEKAIALYESGYFNRVSDEAYSGLTYALSRIEKRLAGE